ncbi:MAG: mechanosensitive ion channel family protein [Candidatus Micrarchaeota archaeon]
MISIPLTFDDVVILFATIAISLIASKIIYHLLIISAKKITVKTKTILDDKIVAAIENPLHFALLIFGLHFGIGYTSINSFTIKATVFEIAIILLVAYTLSKLLDATIAWYNEEVAAKSKHKMDEVISTAKRIGHIIIIVLAATMILRSLGVEITPIIAALGIGGLAIALAFQDTLSNFFAGVYLTVDRPVKIGDYIELENGQKGYAVSIGWRSTQIRTLANNLIIVPNSKMAQATIVNYYAPTPDMSIVIPCSVSYNSDLEKVEKITIETARLVQKKTKGSVPNFDPFIRYNTFGDNGIHFSIILRVKEFTDQYLITHEFVKALHAAYKKAGIEIPFPQRTVHFIDKKSSSK